AWFSFHFEHDFEFARSNLKHYAHNSLPRFTDESKVFKFINFDRLGSIYWAALISLYGLTESTFYLLYPHYDPPPPRPRLQPDPIVNALMHAVTHSSPDLCVDEHFALMWVSSTEEVDQMIHLISKIPDLTLQDMEKFLQCAAAFGALPMVKHFINLGVDPSTEDNLAFRLSAENGNVEVVKLFLVTPKVNPAADNDHAIRMASENGHVGVVRALLQAPQINPAASNNASIVEASCNGHAEVVKLLLESGRVDP
ncbi:hypothetical protein HDU67_004436, partial [Dinochytrium kinnereticum]